MESDRPYVAPFIRRLMPDATEDEIVEASENLRRYLLIMYDIFLEREAALADSPDNAGDDRVELDGASPVHV